MFYPHILYVEGPDDLHAVGHVLDQNGFSACRFDQRSSLPDHNAIAVKALGGYTMLRKTLSIELMSSEVQCAGIIVDANTHPEGRWQSLRDAIEGAGGRNVPLVLPSEGWIGEVQRADRSLRAGAWLMPDNQAPGALEEFARALVPPDDLVWPHAVRSVEELVFVMEADRFARLPISKAHVHTWLAWQNEPGLPVGAAIRDRLLNPFAEPAQAFVGWVRRLFGL